MVIRVGAGRQAERAAIGRGSGTGRSELIDKAPGYIDDIEGWLDDTFGRARAARRALAGRPRNVGGCRVAVLNANGTVDIARGRALCPSPGYADLVTGGGRRLGDLR